MTAETIHHQGPQADATVRLEQMLHEAALELDEASHVTEEVIAVLETAAHDRAGADDDNGNLPEDPLAKAQALGSDA